MKNIHNHYTATFELYDFDFPAFDVMKVLNIQPTNALTKGDPIKHKSTGKVLRYVETGSWALNSSLPPTTPVEEQCVELLQLLRPHKDYIIQRVASGLSCTFAIGGYTDDLAGKVGIDLPREIVKEMSEYMAEIDIDIYANSED